MLHRLVFLGAFVGLVVALAADPPLKTGTHREWVRDGWSGVDARPVRALVVTDLEPKFVAVESALLRDATVNGNSFRMWAEEEQPTAVGALWARPKAQPEVLAAAADGVWALEGRAWRLEEKSPAGVITFAAGPAGEPWALAPNGIWRRSGSWSLVAPIDANDMKAPHAFLPRSESDILVAAKDGLFFRHGKRTYWLNAEVRADRMPDAEARALAPLGAHHFAVATVKGLTISDGFRGWKTFSGVEGPPVVDSTLAVAQVTPAGSRLWLGGPSGLCLWEGGRFRYFAGKRWLPDDRVTALACAPDGSLWIGTASGISHLRQAELSLEEKAAHMQEILETRPRRHDFVTVMHLKAPGRLEGAEQEVSDNDGLWTALHIAAQSYRTAASGSKAARDWASRSMKALLRLESLTGISGFPARAAVHESEPVFKAHGLDRDGEWHPSPVEKGWWWKGETSSDEIDGHYFAWLVFSELAATESEKQAVRATCKRVTDHILDHGFYLVDLDGKPTTWGVWAPEKINDDPIWWEEHGLNSVEILSHLKVAHHLVGEARYEEAYLRLIREHGYARNAIEAKLPRGVSHDDQLYFLAIYPLLRLETDPGLRALYLESLERAWQLERPEANPLWNFIYGALTARPCDVEAAVETLREIPLDLVRWGVRNSHRADLRWDAESEKQGKKRLARPLPFTERQINNWDADPYQLDGGNGHGEGDPTIWLLPYWMGRHHKLIE